MSAKDLLELVEVLKKHWNVFLDSALVSVPLILALLYFLYRLCRSRSKELYEREIANLNSELKLSDRERDLLRQRITELENVQNLPRSELNRLIAAHNLLVHMLDTVRPVIMPLHPTESRSWKFGIWNLTPEEFQQLAAARLLVQAGLAHITPVAAYPGPSPAANLFLLEPAEHVRVTRRPNDT